MARAAGAGTAFTHASVPKARKAALDDASKLYAAVSGWWPAPVTSSAWRRARQKARG